MAELTRILASTGDDLADLRDRALLLVGFLGGLRRSELVALNVGDFKLNEQGYTATIRRSKTDQEGKGRMVALPYSRNRNLCPVAAPDQLLAAAEIDRGPIFRRIRRGDHLTKQRMTARSVNLRLKGRATSAGVNPSGLGAHSLRSGFATHAASQGASE